MTDVESVTLTLQPDLALVLFEILHRPELRCDDLAEIAFDEVVTELEPLLPQLLHPEYKSLVREAGERLVSTRSVKS